MKQLEWKSSKHKLFGIYPCIELTHPGNRNVPPETQYCLCSKRGEIWEYSGDKIRVLLKTSQVAQKLQKTLQVSQITTMLKGEEQVFTLPKTMLSKVVEILGIPKTRPVQARIANAFGK